LKTISQIQSPGFGQSQKCDRVKLVKSLCSFFFAKECDIDFWFFSVFDKCFPYVWHRSRWLDTDWLWTISYTCV